MLLTAAVSAVLPAMAVPVLLGAVLFYALIKAGGREFNLVVVMLLLFLTSSTLDPSFRVAVIVWSLASLAWFAFDDPEKHERMKIPRGIILFAVFTLFFIVLSSLVSINPIKGLSAAFRQAVFLVFAFLIFMNIKSLKDVYLLLATVLLTGLINGFAILYSIFAGGISAHTLLEGPSRFGGLFTNININFSGVTLAVSFLIIVAYFFLKNNRNMPRRAFLLAILLPLSLALLISNSRAALLAAFAGGITFFLIVFPKYRIHFFGGVIVLVLAAFLIPPVNEFLSLMLRFERFLNVRDHLWAMSWESIKDHPLLGTGPDQFKDYFFKYMTASEGSYAEMMIKSLYKEAGDSGLSHNFFLFRQTELGLPGLVSAFWLPGMFILFAVRAMKGLRNTDRDGFILVAASLSVGAGLFARSVFESIGILTHGWLMVDLPFWVCFMVIVYFYRKTRQIQIEIPKSSP